MYVAPSALREFIQIVQEDGANHLEYQLSYDDDEEEATVLMGEITKSYIARYTLHGQRVEE